MTRRNCCAGPGSKVDAPEASSGPGWEIQEVSRLGAQGATSKSKLLALEMLRTVHNCGTRDEPKAAKSFASAAAEA